MTLCFQYWFGNMRYESVLQYNIWTCFQLSYSWSTRNVNYLQLLLKLYFLIQTDVYQLYMRPPSLQHGMYKLRAILILPYGRGCLYQSLILIVCWITKWYGFIYSLMICKRICLLFGLHTILYFYEIKEKISFKRQSSLF